MFSSSKWAFNVASPENIRNLESEKFKKVSKNQKYLVLMQFFGCSSCFTYSGTKVKFGNIKSVHFKNTLNNTYSYV